MLPVFGPKEKKTERLNRRSFVQAGLLGMGGMGLTDALHSQANAHEVKSKKSASVILFWLSGGPGHMETWDPKPLAPQEYRGPFGAITTSVPGIEVSELMPRLASNMKHVSLIRSVHHGTGDHTKGNHWMLTGFEGPDFNAPDNRVQRRPSIGSAISRAKQSNQPDMPSYVAVPHLRGGTDNFFHYHAYLGASTNPFVVNSDPASKSFRVRNLTLPSGMNRARIGDRLSLLKNFEQLKIENEKRLQDLDKHHQQAFQLLTSKRVQQAFDIEKEPDRTRELYGRHTFGQSALVARRLVERGVSFVTVNCVPWDHHGSANRYQTEPGGKLLIPPLDNALAGLIEDLNHRGLNDDVLVVAMGEFGRTPRINKYAGRDHWGNAFSVLMAGGKVKGGRVVGKTSARGEEVVSRPVSPQEVLATIYHHAGIDGANTWFPDRLGRPMPLIAEGEPISELF